MTDDDGDLLYEAPGRGRRTAVKPAKPDPEPFALTLEGTQPPESLALSDGVWGIDPQTTRAAVTSIAPTERGKPPACRWACCEFEEADKGPRRLALALDRFEAFLREFVGATGHVPAYVLVEQPFAGSARPQPGRKPFRPHPEAYFMCAVVQVAALRVIGQANIVETVDPQSWKRAAMGEGWKRTWPGDDDKARILAWARAHGYTGHSQDEADSYGIATAAGVWWQKVHPLR